ncbi:DUF6460 domain-containing protein [Methylocella sp.]|uniref:DUF6460 domain-containing protein n=1 Tax=Methylocella sp. TaxID=1978226 RepID=UPI0035B3A1C4
MSERFTDPASPSPPGWSAAASSQPTAASPARRPDPLTRFLGGSPGSVALRLFLVSMVVGALFMWLGVRPADLLRGFSDFVDSVSRLGFSAIWEALNYALVGAAVVVPIWLVLRLLDMRSNRDAP